MIADRLPSIVVVSTYPPSRCGLASYSASVVGGLAKHRASDDGLHVARVLCPGDDPAVNPIVMTAFDPASPAAIKAAAARISEHDVVLLQHEFGIYGPDDGAAVVDLLERITVPVATTFHTVREAPSPSLRWITDRVAEASDRIVVMIAEAAERLVEIYGVDVGKCVVIPHGASWTGEGRPAASEERPILLTWGLLTPQKGIHHAIAALPDLRKYDPTPLYWIQGKTHPAVVRQTGDAYREGLKRLAARLGVEDMVHFDDRYLPLAELEELVAAAAVVILPYERMDRVTSGVLAEALAMGKQVVATAFTHAIELKASVPGLILTDEAESGQIAKAVYSVLTNPERPTSPIRVAPGAPTWEQVGSRYQRVADELAGSHDSSTRSPRHGLDAAPGNHGRSDPVALTSNNRNE